MADFDLQQTDAQVQAILNDGQSAMGAGAQTTLTTEYVMLKDVNGAYHKILKDSLTEACRNVLASLLVNNDKGTTISQIAAIGSGDFGSITPPNLESLLGVVPSLKMGIGKTYAQCQTLDSGLFFVTDIVGAFSDNETGYSGMILALQYNDSSCLQLAFRLPSTDYGITGAAFRLNWNSQWSKWFKFNYV